jgi:hypothetical protein
MRTRGSLLRRTAALAFVAAGIVLAVGTQPAWADTGQGAKLAVGTAKKNSLAGFLTVTQPGDYAAAGTGMRGTGAGVITIAGIPPGATVTNAYLYWAIVNGAAPSATFDDGFFNGQAISGTSIGTDADPCWANTTTTYAYRADVTDLVNPGGNGIYALSGFATGPPLPTTPFGEPNTPPLNEGASLVVVYTHPVVENRVIVIYNGADTVDDEISLVSTMLSFPAIGPGSAKSTYVVADGQAVQSDQTIFTGKDNTSMVIDDVLDGSPTACSGTRTRTTSRRSSIPVTRPPPLRSGTASTASSTSRRSSRRPPARSSRPF